MLNMKKLMYACVVIIELGDIAMAELPAVPKKFQGTWFCGDDNGMRTIGANTVSFDDVRNKLKLTNIVPGDDDLNSVYVKWLPAGDRMAVEVVWKLAKLNRQQFLIQILPDSPATAILCLKR